jgi:hypothetical protein
VYINILFVYEILICGLTFLRAVYRAQSPHVTRDRPTKVLELCPCVNHPLTDRQRRSKKPKPTPIYPTGGHYVFEPAGGEIPAGSRCSVCEWLYDPQRTLKVRMWNLDGRVRNMVRHSVILQVCLLYILYILCMLTYINSINSYYLYTRVTGFEMGRHPRPHGRMDRRRVRRGPVPRAAKTIHGRPDGSGAPGGTACVAHVQRSGRDDRERSVMAPGQILDFILILYSFILFMYNFILVLYTH